MQKMSVIGAGSWGSALALSLHKNNHKVFMWTRDLDQVDEINNFLVCNLTVSIY